MNVRRFQRAVLVAVAAASLSFAQERGGGNDNARAAATSVSNPIENADVPDAEKVRLSSQSITQMRTSLRDALQRLEEARSTRDVVKLNCVNEKLTRIKGLLRISEQSDVQLQESAAKKEAEVAKQEFVKISIASQKVDQLHAEIEQCIGQLAFRTDENLSVELELPEYLPPGDPSRLIRWFPVDSRPPPASSTR
jgi:hypothetical protein